MYLNCHTYYSLKYGMISPKQLLEEAKKHGVKTFAVTDINNTSVMLDIIRQSQAYDIRIVGGIDFRNGADQQFIGLAKNNKGWFELNKYLSECNHAGKDIHASSPVFDHSFVIYPFGKKLPDELKDNEYMGIRPREINKLLFGVWKHNLHKIVVLQPVTFRNKTDYNAHKILRAIDVNGLISQLPDSELARPDEIMMSEHELEQVFEAYPEVILNTKRILSECSLSFDLNREEGHKNLKTYTGSEQEDVKLMKKLCYDGVKYRYPHTVSDAILDRISMELSTIEQMGFVSYFLIAWDILNYARNKGYYYVGRGSGANSIVAYLLRITDVDPVDLDLYFERFINLFRSTPPDFDIDFSWKDRDDVTDYIFKQFPNVTLLGAYNTFQGKSTIREIGKVFGLPVAEIERLQKEGNSSHDVGKCILFFSEYIRDFPNHISVHSAGIIISQDPLYHYTATFMPPKGFPTTHFDMHIAEDIGLYKFDILGQRGLSKIKDTLEMLDAKGIEVDIHNIHFLKQDVPSNTLLKKGSAIGCFYVESPAMRMLLLKLQVENYLGLVAASSVIRPGVAQSGMMREYILRCRNIERRKWAQKTFPTLYELMPETYGVMVYQEDVIKVAHHFAGLTLGEADVLRRGMSGKYRSREEFHEVKKKFFMNCLEREIGIDHITDVWNQIESFAGYAFAKGHSASYAVESYQCLYLKAHYPLEFMVATINNGGGFYSTEVYVHEAKKHGAKVHLPCINTSDDVAVLHGADIYLGLGMIASLEEKTRKAILIERYKNGGFSNLRDFMNRVPVSLEQVIILIRADVFRFTGKDKKTLLWDAHFILGKTRKTSPSVSLFQTEVKEFQLPELWRHPLENAYDEMELIGYTVTGSPFALVKELPKVTAAASFFPFFINKEVTIVGYLVHIKHTQTKTGQHMFFGTFLDLQGEWIDAVIFPPVAEKYPFSGPGCYLLYGKITEEFGFCSLEIHAQKRIPSANLDEPSTRLKTAEKRIEL